MKMAAEETLYLTAKESQVSPALVVYITSERQKAGSEGSGGKGESLVVVGWFDREQRLTACLRESS